MTGMHDWLLGFSVIIQLGLSLAFGHVLSWGWWQWSEDHKRLFKKGKDIRGGCLY